MTTPGTMRPSARTLVAMAAAVCVLLATVAVGALRGSDPASAAADDRPVTGYTLLREGADVEMVCRLVSIDWASGEITELPAIESTTASARDLAVAPDGTVHGIDPYLYSEPGVAGDVSPIAVETISHFITYSADGTPTAIDMHLPQPYEMDFDLYGQFWGVAIAEDGTIFITLNDLWARVTTCAPGPVFTALDHSTADGAFDWTSCLFTLDPDTGDLTLVGPSTWPQNTLVALSIGSDGARSLLYSVAPADVEPSPVASFVWSSVDLGTGEVLPSGAEYSPINGLYDQLRTRPEIYAITRADFGAMWVTSTVDPTTGAITPIAPISLDGERDARAFGE